MNAAERVWDLVCGLPSGEREARLLMVMQGWFDDSGSDPGAGMFILAGFVASAKQWAAFSNAWKRGLNKPPRLAYFKSNEAYGLKGQFAPSKGWTEERRDARVLELASIIAQFVPEKYMASVPNSVYLNVMHGTPVRNKFEAANTPYYWLMYAIVAQTAIQRVLDPPHTPCDLIFDEQGKVGTEAVIHWETNKRMMADKRFDLRPYIGSPPTFRDDKTFLPLQAADLYAGQWSRVFREENAPVMTKLAKLNDTTRIYEAESQNQRNSRRLESFRRRAARIARPAPHGNLSS